jgi:hypothetical protein
MTLAVTHAAVATLADEPGAEINKAEWNAAHAQTQAGERLLGKTTAGDGPTEELTAAAVAAFVGPQAPAAHAATHADGASDEINVAGLSGLLADPQTPGLHAAAHESGAGDEIDVTGLTGLLATAQTPIAHTHAGGGESQVPEAGLDILNSPGDRWIMSWDSDAGKMEWITTTIYPATSVNLVTGTLNAGSITSFATRNDADIYDVQEVGGVPGIDIRVSFANVASFNLLRFQVDHIDGTGTHKVEYALWNVVGSTWDLLTSLRTTNGFVEADVTADNFANYIDTGASNTVICRMYHPIAGAGGHQHKWEYMVVVDSIAGGGGIHDHAALEGLDVVGSHPATAISNTPAGTIAATTVQAAINELDGDVVAHKADVANPHATTAAQVGLGNVSNDSQLKRAAGDFATFAEKVTPVGADLLLIEDSAASGAKKKVQITNLPGSGGGVTAVTGTAPIASSGGATPDISIADFVASGASHARGAVPDPGASPGTTKFLREDAAWVVPPGGGSGTDEVLLVPTSDKTIPANSSLVVADYYRLDGTLTLTIESGANATIM